MNLVLSFCLPALNYRLEFCVAGRKAGQRFGGGGRAEPGRCARRPVRARGREDAAAGETAWSAMPGVGLEVLEQSAAVCGGQGKVRERGGSRGAGSRCGDDAANV
jgi:hypothetical protein